MFTYNENGTITDVNGFFASGVHAGLRTYKKDLALIYSEIPCTVAGVYTQNLIKAAPVVINEQITSSGSKVSAILVNSKCANACTGEEGLKNALETQKCVAEQLKIHQNDVLISSTGVIGTQLPLEKIKTSIPSLVDKLSKNGGYNAAEAILTTDTCIKSFSLNVKLSSGDVTIGGVCKGSGMIHPNMATMLGFITTDVKVDHYLLNRLLKKAVTQSFNKITVDSETSTNDMVLLLANGSSGIQLLQDTTDEVVFYNALESLCKTMAKSIVSDGEGASKLVSITVKAAQNESDANIIAKTVASSPLVKTALYGEDPNWGRIIAAIGYAGVQIEPDKISISIGEHVVLGEKYNILLDENVAKAFLSEREVAITIELNLGNSETTWWTCDFTKEYISINADYRS